jgi:hypothetical protein
MVAVPEFLHQLPCKDALPGVVRVQSIPVVAVVVVADNGHRLHFLLT